MKTQISNFKSTGIASNFSKLILVIALGFYAGANVYAEDNQGAQASVVKVAMVTVKDSSKKTTEKHKGYFEEKSSTYVSKFICE